jgi:endogenous inhibitor of DNA gyrase (YacG/DUF329 family)
MFCPKCGQQQVSDNIRFCSQCGISIDGLAEWIAKGGNLVVREENAPILLTSPRRKGIRRGAKIVFGSLASTPVFFFFSALIGAPIPMLIPLTFFLIGISVMLYSRIFSEETPYIRSQQAQTSGLWTMFSRSALSATPNNMMSSGDGRQVITSDLIKPPSVTEHTTKLLDRE